MQSSNRPPVQGKVKRLSLPSIVELECSRRAKGDDGECRSTR